MKPTQDLRECAAIHSEIYKAIRSRNPSRAKFLMEKCLRSASQMVETLAESPLREMVEVGDAQEPWNGSYGSNGQANDSLG
jgi:hypothetical protein